MNASISGSQLGGFEQCGSGINRKLAFGLMPRVTAGTFVLQQRLDVLLEIHCLGREHCNCKNNGEAYTLGHRMRRLTLIVRTNSILRLTPSKQALAARLQ